MAETEKEVEERITNMTDEEGNVNVTTIIRVEEELITRTEVVVIIGTPNLMNIVITVNRLSLPIQEGVDLGPLRDATMTMAETDERSLRMRTANKSFLTDEGNLVVHHDHEDRHLLPVNPN